MRLSFLSENEEYNLSKGFDPIRLGKNLFLHVYLTDSIW